MCGYLNFLLTLAVYLLERSFSYFEVKILEKQNIMDYFQMEMKLIQGESEKTEFSDFLIQPVGIWKKQL